jgi:hypothetical protein
MIIKKIMTKILFSLSLLLAGNFLFAQETQTHQRHNNNVPNTVQENFRKDHPDATNEHWAKSNGKYHATYNRDNHHVDDYYDTKGNHVYARTQWDRNSLPADYDQTVRTRYHTRNYKVAKIDRPGNQSLFELNFSIGGKNKTVYTDDKGNKVRFNR